MKEETVKNGRIHLRINQTLKDRYEAALASAGLTMANHLNAQIYEFVVNEEKRVKQLG